MQNPRQSAIFDYHALDPEGTALEGTGIAGAAFGGMCQRYQQHERHYRNSKPPTTLLNRGENAEQEGSDSAEEKQPCHAAGDGVCEDKVKPAD